MRSISEKLVEVSRPRFWEFLLVDALNVFGNHAANSGTHFRVGRLLAARTFAAPLAADRADEAASLHVAAANRSHAAAFQSEIRNLAQRLIEVKTIVRGSDLVGRNVVAQLRIIRRIFRVPGQILARELPLDKFRIFGEKECVLAAGPCSGAFRSCV